MRRPLIALAALFLFTQLPLTLNAYQRVPGSVIAFNLYQNTRLGGAKARQAVIEHAEGPTMSIKVPGAGNTDPNSLILTTSNNVNISAGDTLMMDFAIAAVRGHSANIQIGVLDMEAKEELYTYDVSAGTKFAKYFYQFEAPRDYQSGDLRFVLRMGSQKQHIRISDFYVRNANSEELTPAPRYFDFEEPFQEPKRMEETTSRVVGTMPEGLIEDSQWKGAKVDIEYAPLQREAYEGDQALRVNLKKIKKGQAQMLIEGIKVKKDQEIHITMAYRSTAPFWVQIQKDGWPYKVYWEEELPPRKQWKQGTFKVRPKTSTDEARITFKMLEPGMLDFDNVKVEFKPRVPEKVGHIKTYDFGPQDNKGKKSLFNMGI